MIFRNIFTHESACKLAFAMVCITRSDLFPAQFPTGLVAVWASPIEYIVNFAERKLPQTTSTTTTSKAATWGGRSGVFDIYRIGGGGGRRAAAAEAALSSL